MSNHIDTNWFTPQTFVDPFAGKDAAEAVFVDCPRCGGVGYIAGFENIHGGVCFECTGHKGHQSTVAAERKKAKGKVAYANTKNRKLVAKQEFHNAQMVSAETAFPILAGWFEAMATDAFLTDLWTKAFEYVLSERQIEAAAKGMQRTADRTAQRQAEHDALSPAPAGKERITGTVLTVQYRESAYGDTWKMIVLDDRQFKVWATVTEAFFTAMRVEHGEPGLNPLAESLIGRRVEFNVTLEVSDTDDTFAFGKRPTKVVLQAQHTEQAPEEAPAAEEAAEAPAAPATVTPAGETLTHKDGTEYTLLKVLSETHYSVSDSTGKVFRKRRSVFV